MNKSGRTPLFRAKKIEAILGIKEIYFKLEGTNPFGHKFDRIGETIAKDAVASKKSAILIDGPRRYINAIKSFAEIENIDVFIPHYRGQSWKKSAYESKNLIPIKRNVNDNQQALIEDLCEKRGYYNAVNGYYNQHISMLALEEIGEELLEKFEDISTVFLQLGYGYTVSSLYNSFFRGWVKGELDRYPQIFSCTIPKGNMIYEDYKVRNQIIDIDEYDLKLNKYSRHLYIDDTQLLEDTLKAVKDTDGEIITVDEKLLKEAATLLKNKEYLKLSAEEAYSFAGFYKLAKQGKIKNGKHVIILNDGRSDIRIKRLEDFKTYSLKDIRTLVDTFLAEYSDPKNSIEDAILNAVGRGAVFIATLNDEPQGVMIVVNLGFSEFIPTYHLAYIGTHKGRKGRGIASALIDAAIDFSDGNISLHVDLDNKGAKKLYEKFGFKHMYNRMIFQKS